MVKIALSAGHGPATPGKRTPSGINEHDFNYPTAEYTAQYLNEYEGVQILKVYSRTRDVPLAERTSKANSWGADLYQSIHYNAAGPGGWYDAADGIETLVYSKASGRWNGYDAARKIHPKLINAARRDDRGIKARPELWELRKTTMPAILCECGFMTNRQEAALMLNKSYQQKVARAIADGIADYYNLKKKKTAAPKPAPAKPAPNTGRRIYRVQIGAFSKLANANEQVELAKKRGFKDAYAKKEGSLYKVQIGAFSVYNNAKELVELAKNKGFKDAFIS